MAPARQLKIVGNCHKPSHRPVTQSGNICLEVVGRLGAFAIPVHHPKGAVIFVEGHPSRGAFILYSGRMKIFTSSTDGRVLILKFAGPGDILGLAATVSGQVYEAWAEAIEPTQTGFVERGHLVHLIRHDSELAVQIAMLLGESYNAAIAGVRVMGLSRCVSQKLATFLLDWCKCNRPIHDHAGSRLTLTHEEIAQIIGTSRETVARLLSQFKKRGLIEWKGRNLFLLNRAVLESSAAD